MIIKMLAMISLSKMNRSYRYIIINTSVVTVN